MWIFGGTAGVIAIVYFQGAAIRGSKRWLDLGLLPLSAFRVRQGPVRARARRLSGRALAAPARVSHHAHRARPGVGPDLPRLPAARLRHGARVLRGRRRGALRRRDALDAHRRTRGRRRGGRGPRARRPARSRPPDSQAVPAAPAHELPQSRTRIRAGRRTTSRSRRTPSAPDSCAAVASTTRRKPR